MGNEYLRGWCARAHSLLRPHGAAVSTYTMRATASGYVVALLLCGRTQRTYLVRTEAEALAIARAWAELAITE